MDIVGKPLLCACVEESLQAATNRLIIDLAGVSFMDAQGVSALVICRRRALQSGSALVLARAPALVLRLLTLTALQHSFTLMA
jgi:anti-sigma B factor antagonist